MRSTLKTLFAPCSKRFCLQLLSLLLFCLTLPVDLALADRFATVQRSTQQGLTQSQVRAVMQDSKGYLWIGTLAGGLDRFDGLKYTHYTMRQGLPSNIVYKIIEHRDTIYVGTRQGLARMTSSGSFVPILLPEGFNDPHVTDIGEDANGRLFIATYSGLFEVNGNALRHEPSVPAELKAIVLDRDGTLWVATANQLYKRPRSSNTFEATDFPTSMAPIRRLSPRQRGGLYVANRHDVFEVEGDKNRALPLKSLSKGDRIASLYEDKDGSLWVGTAVGALHLKPDGTEQLIGPEQGGPSASITSIFRDSEGTLHLGSNGEGLVSLPTVPFTTWTYGPLTDYAPTRPIWIPSDSGHTLYIPTLGSGLWRLQDGQLKHFDSTDGLQDPDVVFVHPDQKGNIWIGLSTGLAQLKGDRIISLPNLPARFKEHWFLEVAEDTNGTLCFATSGGLLLYENGRFTELGPEQGLPAEELMSIRSAGKNTLWIGSHNGAILYNFADRKVLKHLSTKNGLPSNSVGTIYQGKKGHWWFGTDLGLVQWQNKVLHTFTWDDGLPEGHITFLIQPPTNDELWIGTSHGVAVWDGERFRTYTHAQGLPAIETNSYAAAVDPQGRLWLGTEHGYGIYDPAIEIPNQSLDTLLNGIQVDGKSMPEHNALELNYKQGSVRWNFLSPTYLRPDRVTYRVRLVGTGEPWEEISERTVRYTALNPGSYYFEVSGCVEGQCDPTPARSPLITIQPPWYQNPAVIAGGLALIFFAGVLVTYGRSLRLRRRAEELETLVNERTLELASEKDISESLLQNILPRDIIGELKDNGRVQPRRFQDVSILFTDLKGFTKVSATVPPERLVQQLNDIFAVFDRISQEHGLEKLKTIGDAYMAVGGLPLVNDSHPHDAVKAGLKMQAYMAERRSQDGAIPFELRVGIHTGPVVAGVIGTWKYAYDIWGDAVNIAARMESNGAPGQVNISKSTFSRVNNRFECEARGKKAVKGRGELEMFFIRGND